MPLRKTPIPSISTSTTSPGFIQSGGIRFTPTPPGVPVTITSPRFERVERRTVFNQSRNIEDHLPQRGLLHDLSIQPGHDRARSQIGEFFRRNHPGTEAARPGKVLSRRELVRVVLPVSHAAIVVAGIAGDMIEGSIPRNIAPALSDDQRQFAFEIKVVSKQRGEQCRVRCPVCVLANRVKIVG